MKIVTYFRVSTAKQGQSGLGLEGQQVAVAAYVASNGAEVVAEYTEVESGKRSNRPELARALAAAKRHKATLVIAKLDRLARNVYFVSGLMESGVEFVACDNPNANKLTIHILAAVAEDEARRISERTKAALAAAKARGVKLGSARKGHWEGHEDRRQAGQRKAIAQAAVNRSLATAEAYADLVPDMVAMRATGATLDAIATKLNAEGQTTQRGLPWTATAVYRVLGRVAAQGGQSRAATQADNQPKPLIRHNRFSRHDR